jgi:hypothetical protein
MRLSNSFKSALWSLTLLAIVVLALPHAAAATSLIGVTGATATYTPTKSTDVPKIWRKVQSNLLTGFNFMCDEWDDMADLDEFETDWTTREILVPVDLTESYGASSIPEGGYETVPSTPAPDELSISFIMLNKRFGATKLTRYIDEKSRDAQIKQQLKYQGKKALEALARTFSDYFWGVSTAYLAQTSTAATATSGQAYTLLNPYGSSTLNNTTTAGKKYLGQLFRVGDRVALIRAGALVTNAIGTVTAKSNTTPSITVTWNGSVTSVANDYIVLANSLENTTIAGTDYNLGLVGYTDGMLSASVHGLSNASQANWDVASGDATGGRLNGIRLHGAIDEIANQGGVTADIIRMSQGVHRDLIAQQLAALRFSDPFSMELDGEVKAKGRMISTSRRVPTGCAFVGKKNTIQKMNLLPKPGQGVAWNDGKELIDQSGYVFSMDFPCATVWKNRKAHAYFTGLTES